MNETEELKELGLFTWTEEDLAKPKEQSPKFGYLKSIGNNFKKIAEKDKKFNTAINNKVDKQEGKDLSTNDFTDTYKQKLDDLENYDDTEMKQKYNELQQENIELKKTQDDMIEKQLNKETAVDTSVIVKDSDEFYGKLSIFGGQRQEKREGYNKFNIDTVASSKYINVGNGVLGNSETSDTSDYMQVVANKSYTLSYDYETLTAAGKRGYCYFDENKQYISGSEYTSSNKSTTFTAQQDGYIRFAYDKNCTNIMFCEGVEEKPYESYGIMPSLQYPSEIEAVGDNINIFDKDTMLLTQGLWINTTSLATNRRGWYVIVPIEGGQPYTISRKAKETFYVTTTADYPANGVVVVDSWKVATNTERYAINANQNAKYLFLGLAAADSLTDEQKANVINELKVEKGSKATSYSSFRQGSVEITTSNKNLYNQEKFIQGIWNTNETTRVVGWLGKVKARQKIVVKRYNSKYEYLLGITTMKYRNSANVLLYNDGWRTTEKSEMTATVDGYIFLQIRNKDNSEIIPTSLLANDFQVEFDEATDYVEHKGKTHIMPIQSKMFDGDTFEKIDGVWYEVHNKVKRIFDGTENWNFNYNSAIFMLDANNILTLSSAETSKLSNFIQSNTYSNKVYDTMYNKETDGIEALNNRINIRESSCSTVEEFKAMLAQRYAENKAIYAVCRLKEPLLIKCTEEQSAILDKIDTYKDGTIITTDNNLCKIQLRYKQNLESAIKEYTATNVAESE